MLINEQVFLKLYYQGRTDTEISKVIGAHPKSVSRFRIRRGLPRNLKGSKPSKQNEIPTSYINVLPPEKWEFMNMFLKMCTLAERRVGVEATRLLIHKIHFGEVRIITD